MDFIPKKRLGFGLMRMPTIDPSNDADVDVEQVKAMVDHFIAKGFIYFDTAWMYNGSTSESVAKQALVERHPRESFTLATKLHAAFFNSPEDRDKVFHEQLQKTGAGYFDYYLLHGIEAAMLPKYEQFDCFNWLLEKKRQGLVKHAGFSYHDSAELLDKILTKHPEMEFVQLQINYLDWESKWIQSRACYDVCVRHGKPVVVMEPVKGSRSGRDIDKAAKAGLTLEPPEKIKTPGIREYPITLECRVLYSQPQELLRIPEDIRTAMYPQDVDGTAPMANRDVHTAYIGQIVSACIIR